QASGNLRGDAMASEPITPISWINSYSKFPRDQLGDTGRGPSSTVEIEVPGARAQPRDNLGDQLRLQFGRPTRSRPSRQCVDTASLSLQRPSTHTSRSYSE